MPGLCIAVAVSAVVLARLPDRITLAWEHTVEKTRWEEDYALVERRLVLEQARIEGTGAGMEMPGGAVFDGHVWRYRPDLPALAEVRFTNSLLPRGYEICVDGRCASMRELIGDEQRQLVLLPCDADALERDSQRAMPDSRSPRGR